MQRENTKVSAVETPHVKCVAAQFLASRALRFAGLVAFALA
jgi:hypothetical protein